MLGEMVTATSRQVGKMIQEPGGRMRGFLVEIFRLSQGKPGMRIGWVLDKERVFQDFHPEICKLTILAQG